MGSPTKSLPTNSLTSRQASGMAAAQLTAGGVGIEAAAGAQAPRLGSTGWLSADSPRARLPRADWRDAISQQRINVDELWLQAKAQRMQRVMAPYLEALL
jgi:hypothetical protein